METSDPKNLPTNSDLQSQIAPATPVPTPVDVGPGITIQNMVGTISVGCPLDLNQINSRVRYSEYNPGKFHGLIMKILNPRTTCLAFQSGKLLILGAKHEHDCKLASRKFAKILKQLGHPIKYQGFKIHNIVCTCDVRFPVKLDALHHVHSQFSSYEPELFPGLIYRMVKPRVVLLIFVNGRIVITGAKSRSELHEAFDNIYPVLKSFKKQ
ncbi:TATA-box-binding protein-like isoform X2 [Diaphorina citri]|uniref:TATA-box-binding protein-like isoform X1 n=2 Tax=Diaphorina citri TaxID=121845 RepID=A0A1S4EHZ9_DIACI|nr:TATA-box-binding protein-like isoform X1 [Diaphorina citri]XP_017301707.1 TATA-box-binding protein-like isoform X2 [Diaphorina citri]KAI5745638.1 hypothetical protein M8J76_013001 [Diaphorina citri]